MGSSISCQQFSMKRKNSTRNEPESDVIDIPSRTESDVIEMPSRTQHRRCSIYADDSTQASLMGLYGGGNDVSHTTLKSNRDVIHYQAETEGTDSSHEKYKEIDYFALQIPVCNTESSEQLANYCKSHTQNPTELVRMFYRWIAENISYDMTVESGRNTQESDSAYTLKSRTAKGSGYAHLFGELCKYAGIETKTIIGFTKNIEHDMEETFTIDKETTHTWNVVYVEDQWEIVDNAWGSGIIDTAGKRFLKEYSDFYFFPDPKYFIGTHFPFINGNLDESKKWQLLNQPIDLNFFSKSVRCTTKAYTWGIRCISHPQSVIISSEIIDVLIECQKKQLLGVLAVFTDQRHNKTFRSVFVREVSGAVYKATVRPPYVGRFLLQLFGSTDHKLLCYSGLLEYIVVCVKSDNIFRPYPEESYISDTWRVSSMAFDLGFNMSIYESNARIVTEPGEFELSLETSKPIEAVVRLKYAKPNDIENVTQYATTQCSPDRVTVKARFPKVGFYQLDLYYKASISGNEKHIISYLVDCKHPSNPCLPYPGMAEMWESI